MTDIRGFLTDENAVSPVIGVVLMVAVTVILSAAVGAFVLDIGNAVTEQQPQAAFTFQSNHSTGSPDAVNITHNGGDTIDSALLRVTIHGDLAWKDGSEQGGFTIVESDWGGDISSGDKLVLSDSGSADIDEGDEVQVIWQKEQRSSVIASGTV
jgi:flagellin-like protein